MSDPKAGGAPGKCDRSNGEIRCTARRPLMIGRTVLGRRLLEKLERARWVGWTVVSNDARLSFNIEKHARPLGSHGLGLTGFMNRLQTSGPGEKNARAEKRSPRERGGGLADLIVDVSGDPSVRGMLAAKNVSRCATVIITPDGEECVLLLEDWSRGLRLDGFEAQYYRWLLHRDAGLESGAEHTAGVQRGRAGREAPTRTSPDALASHADALRRRIRWLVHKPIPAFIVSRHAGDGGTETTYSIQPHPTLIRNICGRRFVVTFASSTDFQTDSRDDSCVSYIVENIFLQCGKILHIPAGHC